MANINAQFNYSANFGPVIGQMQKLTAEANLLNNTLQNLDKQSVGLKQNIAGAFASDLGKIGGWNAKMVELTDSVDQFGQSLLKQKLTLKQYAQEAIGAFTKSSNAHKLAVREVSREMSQLVTLGKGMDGKQMGMMITPATINLKDFNTQLAVSQKQWSIFNSLVQDGTTHLINFGKNTQWAGRQITVGLTVPLTIYGNTVSKIFREVDAELTRFQKVYGSDLMNSTSDATDQMVNDVRNLAIEFSKSFGIAAKETASLAADLAATGLEGQKLLASLRETTRLAVLGDVSNQDAMKTTLSLQNAFKISTDELAESVNFLNAVENQTSLSLQDLTTAIPKAGPVVKALGGDVKDLSLLMVALKEGGISAAEGANALKSGMASLINPTKQASITAKQYGIDINAIVQANRGQLMPTIIAFQQQLQLLDDFGKAQVIENVFGKYQFARISALFDNLNASASQTNAVLGLMGKSNKELAATAYQEMDTLMNSSSKRFQRAIEGIKAEFISIGQSITSSITPILENVTGKIQRAIEFFQNLPKPVKSFIKVATGLTAIAGPIIMMVGIFSNFLGYIGKGAMGMVNLGRRMAGIPVERFDMLTDTQIMAQKATDQLAQSFDRERSSVERLNQALGLYKQNLADAISLNPAFINRQVATPAPTTTTPQLRMGGRMPGYANNSSAWVPGSGDGDKVPAMLEPGEYVVNKKAAAKYSGTLDQINYQSAPRFQKGGRMPGYADTSMLPYESIREVRQAEPFIGPLPQISYGVQGTYRPGGYTPFMEYPFSSRESAEAFQATDPRRYGGRTSRITRDINDPQQQAYADWIAGHNSNQFRTGTGVMKRLDMEGHRDQMLRSMGPISQNIPLYRGTVLKEKGANEFSGVGARELLMYIKYGMFEKAMGKKIQWSDMQSFSSIPNIANYSKFIESWTNPSNTNSKKAADRQLASMEMLPVIFRLASAKGQNGFNLSERALVQEVGMGDVVDEKEWVLNSPSGTITGIRQDMGTKNYIIDLMQKGGRVQSHAEESKDLSEYPQTYKVHYVADEYDEDAGAESIQLVKDYGKGIGATVTFSKSDAVKDGWFIDQAFSSGAPQTAIIELMVQARKMVQEQGGDLSVEAMKTEASYSSFSAPMLLAAERMGLLSFSKEERSLLSGNIDGAIEINNMDKKVGDKSVTSAIKFVKTSDRSEKIDALPNWKKELLNQKGIPLFKQMGGRIQSHADSSFPGVPTVDINPNKLQSMGGINALNPVSGLDKESNMFYKQITKDYAQAFSGKSFMTDAMINEAVFSQLYRSGLFGSNVTGIDQKLFNTNIAGQNMPVLGSAFMDVGPINRFAPGIDEKTIEAMLSAQILGNRDTHSGNFGVVGGKIAFLDNTSNLLSDTYGNDRSINSALNDFSFNPSMRDLDMQGAESYERMKPDNANSHVIKYLNTVLGNLNSGNHVSQSIKLATQGSPELLQRMNAYAVNTSIGGASSYEELLTSIISMRTQKLMQEFNFDKKNMTLVNSNTSKMRLQSHADESLMPEKYSKKMENIQSIMDATSQEASGGMYAGMPMTDIGNLVDRIGGRSAAIPGASGIYEQGGVRSVVKGHNTATSARIEAIASALTRSVFGLESPVQEFIKFAHPETSSPMFGVRSPFDEKFAKTSGSISPDKFFMQALSAIIRGDMDLQPDNLYDGIVVDQGAGYGSDRASQPRELTGKKFSVQDQAKVNFLMQKGGAKKWFTEATAGIASGMTREQYIGGFMQAISTAQANLPAAMASLAGMNLTKEEQQIFGVLAGDLQEAQGIDWGSIYDHHIGVIPEVKKPPTEAAAAKALLTKQANKEEYEKAVAAGYPSWMGFASGGRINGYADGLGKQGKSLTTIFGRMNPPHAGHGILLDAASAWAQATGSDFKFDLSSKEGDEKNPLSLNDKYSLFKMMFPQYAANLQPPSAGTKITDKLQGWVNNGYTSADIFLGEDQAGKFKNFLPRSAEELGLKATIHAVGRPEGAMSATALRSSIERGDMQSIMSFVPGNLPPEQRQAIAKKLSGISIPQSKQKRIKSAADGYTFVHFVPPTSKGYVRTTLPLGIDVSPKSDINDLLRGPKARVPKSRLLKEFSSGETIEMSQEFKRAGIDPSNAQLIKDSLLQKINNSKYSKFNDDALYDVSGWDNKTGIIGKTYQQLMKIGRIRDYRPDISPDSLIREGWKDNGDGTFSKNGTTVYKERGYWRDKETGESLVKSTGSTPQTALPGKDTKRGKFLNDFMNITPASKKYLGKQSGGRINGYATETTTWAKKAAAPKAYAGVLQNIPNWATKPAEYQAIVEALRAAGVPDSDRLASFYIQDVLAHINPSTTNANGIYEKVWSAANLMKDSQVYNVFLETLRTRKDIGGLLNPSTVSRVAGASGLSASIVQAELTKIADGVHPNTANGAKVMMTLARMFPSRTSPGMPIAVAAGMGARLQGNFYDTLGQRALPSNLPNTTVRAYDPKGTGAPTSTTQGSRTASSGIVMPSGAIRPSMVMPNIQSIPSAAGGTGTSATVKVDGMGNVLSNGIDDMVAKTITGQPIAVSSKELLAIGPGGGIAGVTSPGDEARGKIVHPMGTSLMRGGKFQRLRGFADESMTEPVYPDQMSGGRMDRFGASLSMMIGGFNSVRYALDQYTSETNYATTGIGKFTAKMNLAVQGVSMLSQLSQNGGAQKMQSFGRTMDFSQIDAQNRDPAMIARIEKIKQATARLQSIYEAQGVEDAETRAKTKGAGAVLGARQMDLMEKGYSGAEAGKLIENRANFGSGKITSKLSPKLATGLGKTVGALGSGLSKLGGPGPMMALQFGVMAVTKAVEIYQAEMVKAREAGNGAFKEPLETAKLLGVELKSLTADTERYAKFAETLFGSQGRGAYDKVFAETVKKDYGDFLDILAKTETKQEQINQLMNVYGNLIQRGMDPKNARDLTAEIARQGKAMTAFNEAQGKFSLKDTTADAMKMQTESLDSQIQILNKKTDMAGTGYNPLDPNSMFRTSDIGSKAYALNPFSGLSAAITDSAGITTRSQATKTRADAVNTAILGDNKDSWWGKALTGTGLDRFGPVQMIGAQLVSQKNKEQIAAQIGATLKGAFSIAAQDPVASNEAVNAIVANFKNADMTKVQEEVGIIAEEFGFGDLTNTGMFIDSTAFTDMGEEGQALFLNALKSGLGPELDKMLADGDLSPEEKSALEQKVLEAQAIMKVDFEIDLQIDETTKQLQSVQDELNKLFDVALKGKQEEIVAEDKRHENAMKNLDNESQRLNDKKQLLQRNTDYYIKELQREKQAEDYYAGQRDTAIQGLSAISQGDVFGFIGAQMKAASTADQFGRDRSIESIQETSDKAQQKLDDELKAIDLRKQAESERHAAEIDNINLEIEALNKKKATASGDIQKAIKLLVTY